MTSTKVTEPGNGSLTLSANGSFVYLPSPNFSGIDRFTYSIGDMDGDVDTATVSIVITPINDTPVAENVFVTAEEKTPVSISLKAQDADNDSIVFAIKNMPANGTLVGQGANWTYTPEDGFIGNDSFSYCANDGQVDSEAKVVSIFVASTNAAPEAIDGKTSGKQNASFNVRLSAVDPDGDPLTYTIARAPRYGSLSGNAPNFVYTPNPEYVGFDSILFYVNDGRVDSSPATFSIEVIDKRRFPSSLGDFDSVLFVASATLLSPGESLVLSASNTSGSSFSYSWYKDDELIAQTDNGIYNIPNVVTTQTGNYHVIASKGVTKYKSPQLFIEISDNPTKDFIAFDSSEKLRGILGRDILLQAPLEEDGYTYSWAKEGNILAGETSPTLLLRKSIKSQEGDYYVQISKESALIATHRIELRFSVEMKIVVTEGNLQLELDAGEKAGYWRLEFSNDLSRWELVNKYYVIGKQQITFPLGRSTGFYRLTED